MRYFGSCNLLSVYMCVMSPAYLYHLTFSVQSVLCVDALHLHYVCTGIMTARSRLRMNSKRLVAACLLNLAGTCVKMTVDACTVFPKKTTLRVSASTCTVYMFDVFIFACH